MKIKILFLVLTFVISGSSFVFSEGLMSFGFEYPFIFENYTDNLNKINNTTNMPGINLTGFFLFNETSLGLFAHIFLGFPQNMENKIDDVKILINTDNHIFFGFLIGPVYKFNLHENVNLFCGIGFNFSLNNYNYKQYEPYLSKDIVMSYNNNYIGISTDLLFSFKVINELNFNIGSIFTYDFANFINLRTEDGRKTGGWAKSFSSFSIRPFLSIGISI